MGRAGAGHRFDPSLILLDPAATALSNGARWGEAARAVDAAPRLAPQRVHAPALSLAGGRPAPDAARRHHHLRAARPRLHLPSVVAGRPSRHLRRPDREDPLSADRWASPPSSCCRSTSSTSATVRSRNPDTGERLRNFWGYNSIAFAALKAAYASTATEHGQVDRVPRDGPRLPRRRHRGLSRRGLQPHRRRRRARPDLLLPRPGQSALLHARRRTDAI